MLYITYRVGLSTILISIYRKGTSIQQEPEFGTSKHCRNAHGHMFAYLGESYL